MPTIPAYLTPQVEERPVGTPYDRTDTRGAHGEATARAVQGLGELAGQIAQQEKAKADTAAILTAESDFRRHLNGLWADPKEGLTAYKGAALQGRDVEALRKAKEYSDKILAGLSNDVQRQEFARRAESHGINFEENVNRYSLQQRDLALGHSVELALKDALDEVALHFDNKAGREDALRGAGEVLEKKAQLMGLDAQGRAALERDFEGQAVLKVLDGYLAQGRAPEARSFLKDNREAFGDQVAKVERAIDQAEKQRFEATSDSRYKSAFSAYLTGRSLSAIAPEDRAWLIKNDPDQWDRIAQKARRDAEYWKAKGEGRGGETADEKRALAELFQQSGDDPERFRAMSGEDLLAAWGDRLSPAGTKSALLRLEQVKRRKAADDVGEEEARRTVQAAVTGVLGAKKQDKIQAKVNGFVEWRDRFIRDNQKQPSRKEVHEWLRFALFDEDEDLEDQPYAPNRVAAPPGEPTASAAPEPYGPQMPPESTVSQGYQAVQQQLGQPVRVTSKADVGRLPSGTRFVGPSGKVRIKP